MPYSLFGAEKELYDGKKTVSVILKMSLKYICKIALWWSGIEEYQKSETKMREEFCYQNHCYHCYQTQTITSLDDIVDFY